MNYEDTLLFESLIQIGNISSAREEEYWNQGIYTLEDLGKSCEYHMSFFNDTGFSEIRSTIENQGKDIRKIIDIFDKKTGKKDYYRVAYSIPESVMFLDITVA